MKKVILQSNEPSVENIMKLIELIKSLEKEKGLSNDEIIKKYTHSDCKFLVSMVQQIIPKVKPVLFVLDEEKFHYFIGVDLEQREACQKSKQQKKIYFDINGKKSYEEACAFMSEEFNGARQNIMTVEGDKVVLNNDISQEFLNLVKCRSQEKGLEK